MVDESKPADSSASQPWRDWQFYAVLLIALVVRGTAGYLQLDRLDADPDGYRLLARNIVDLRSYTLDDVSEPTAFRPPLYPLLLAVTSVSGKVDPIEVCWLHTVLGVLTAALTYAWTVQVGQGRFRMMAPILVIFDPLLINQSALIMTETLAALLAVLTLVAATQLLNGAQRQESSDHEGTVQAVNVAGAAMLAFFCRPTFLVWVVLLAPLMLFARGNLRHRLIRTAAYTVTVLFLLSPWVVRNWLVFEAPVIGTTHGGYTLLWGNNPRYYEFLKSGNEATWDSSEFHADFANRYPYQGTSESELVRDRAAAREAWANMSANPRMAVHSSLVRLTMFWRPLPHSLSPDESWKRRWVRYSVGCFYVVEFFFVVVGLFSLGSQLRRPAWVAALLLVCSFTVVHLFYWSNIRMRSPLVPVLAVLATTGGARVLAAARPSREEA